MSAIYALQVAGLKGPALVEWVGPDQLAGETEPVVVLRLDDLSIIVGEDLAEQIADGIVEALATHDSLPVWPRS